jgi:hypothetical protein
MKYAHEKEGKTILGCDLNEGANVYKPSLKEKTIISLWRS